MTAAADIVGLSADEARRRDGFLRWQCRVRQLMMRRDHGRPTDGATPSLTLPGHDAPMGHVVTVLSKRPAFSKTPELKHMVRRTHDPAQRREKALQFVSETYFQKAREFSDVLTATLPPRSVGAAAILEAGRCALRFDAYAQRFELNCAVEALASTDPLHQSTWWHNLLFNPSLPADATILAFRPDWSSSRAEPPV